MDAVPRALQEAETDALVPLRTLVPGSMKNELMRMLKRRGDPLSAWMRGVIREALEVERKRLAEQEGQEQHRPPSKKKRG